MMPIGDPRDSFFYPILMLDSYILAGMWAWFTPLAFWKGNFKHMHNYQMIELAYLYCREFGRKKKSKYI